MIASIIPIKRLPRHLPVFDYRVLPDTQKKIKPGQLVRVPFRKSEIFGLVLNYRPSTGKDNDTTLKEMISIVHEEPIVSEKQIHLMQTLALLYGVSVGVIAKMMLLPLQKRKLGKMSLIPLKAVPRQASLMPTLDKTTKPNYHSYRSVLEHKKRLLENIKGQTLILVPEVYLIEEVFNLLPKKLQDKTIIWQSDLSIKEKFERWLEIRNKKKSIVVGLRTSIFLPFTNLKTIIIDFEGNTNHKHWDQAPRFHVKDIAVLLENTYGVTLHLMSYTVSTESYFHVHKKTYMTSVSLDMLTSADTEKPISIVDMSNERRAKNYSFLADTVEAEIQHTKKDIFLFINRLGFATSVGCNDCGYIQMCQQCKLPLVYHEKSHTVHCHYCRVVKPMHLTCPKCGSAVVRLRGVGTEQIENQIRKLFVGKSTHEIVRIDSNAEGVGYKTKKPKIIIGTQMAFQHIAWSSTDLIVFIDIDKQLALPEFKAQEQVWHLIQTVQTKRKKTSAFHIQTFNPKQLVLRSLKEPERFYRTDLHLRRSLGYPPYTYLVRYFCGHKNQAIAKKNAEDLYTQLNDILTKAKKKITLVPPIEMHPPYYRSQFWYTIVAKFPVESWQKDLALLNHIVPERFKIDPNPISILSP